MSGLRVEILAMRNKIGYTNRTDGTDAYTHSFKYSSAIHELSN